jgi:hypothetical protein
MAFLLVILACSQGGAESGDGLPPGCDTTDPGGRTCSVPDECVITCLCTGGSTIEASSCEGQCGSPAALCPTYCQGVGWDGLWCFEPR